MYFSRLITLALLLSSGVSGRDLWVRMRSDSFDVMTNCGASTGRQVVRLLEEIRQVLPAESGSSAVQVFVFRSEAGFKSYAAAWQEGVGGYYRPDGDRDYIVAWNNGAPFDRVILHEYVHLAMHRNGVRAPPWLNEGLAELYSPALSGIAVGGRAPAHIAALQSQAWTDLPKLFAILHPSEIFNFAAGANMFYAESWALAAMLKLDPQYRDGMEAFLARLQNGESSEPALVETYRKTAGEIMGDLRQFVYQTNLPRQTLKAREPDHLAEIRAEPMSPLESGLKLAGLQTALSGYHQAEQQLRSLLPGYVNVPELHAGLADLLLRQDRRDEALVEYENAIRHGSMDGNAYFEAASLMRDREGGSERAISYLRRSIELDPKNRDARELLGMLYLSAARDREAVEQLRAAARLAPDKMWTWQNLAVAEHNIGETQRAIDAARQARALAKTQPEIDMTDATIHLASSEPSARLPGFDGPSVFTPKSWENPQGDSRVEGELVRLDCMGAEARLHVSTGRGDVALHVGDPSKVVLVNPPSSGGAINVELACGDWKPPRPVIVDYVAKQNTELATVGEVTAVRFR